MFRGMYRGSGNGGGGGDQHNLGWYATPEALRTAHATATAGDWAIVGSTDTVWIWDTDTNAWKDSDQKGQVTSVNNQTGDVIVQETLVSGTNIKTVNNTSLLGSGNITIDSLPAQSGQSGKFLTTDGTDASWGSISFPVSSVNNQTGAVTLTASDVGALPDNTHIPADPVQADWDEADSSALDYIKNKPTIPAAQVNSDWNANSGVAQILNKPSIPTKASDVDAVPQLSTLPTASADNVGDIVQFVGTTTSSYTNGYFYKCVSDGQNPATYSWEAVEVQASSGGGSSYTAGTGINITNDVISVTAPTLQNTATTAGYLSIFGSNSGAGVGICGNVGSGNLGGIAIGGSTTNTSNQASAGGQYGAIAIGRGANASGSGTVAIGRDATASGSMSVAIGYVANSSGSYAIQLGQGTNSTANTFSVGLGQNNNYRLLDSNGTIPEARLADTTNATAGQVLTLDSNLNAVWATGGSGGGVSDVTVNGTSVVSGGVAAITGMVQNTATGNRSLSLFGVATSSNDAINIGLYSESAERGIAIGYNAISATNMFHGGIAIGDDTYARTVQIAIGNGAKCYNQGFYGVAIGQNARTSADSAMQISLADSVVTNSDANTVKIANTNGNFEMMSADGTIPTDRFTTTPSTDGAYVPTLTISSGVATRSWGAPSGIVDPHRVIDFQAPTAQNNYTWYRKYADGWVEQGGVYTGSLSAGNSVAITLAVVMSDANYTLNITGEQNSNNYSYAVIADGSKTTTGFSLFAGGASSGDSIKAACWQVSGMAA